MIIFYFIQTITTKLYILYSVKDLTTKGRINCISETSIRMIISRAVPLCIWHIWVYLQTESVIDKSQKEKKVPTI